MREKVLKTVILAIAGLLYGILLAIIVRMATRARHGTYALLGLHSSLIGLAQNMTTWLSRAFAFLVLGLTFFPVGVAASDDAEIARLIKQLGHDEFEKREAATTRLQEIGEPALDALRKAAIGNDPEVRRRAKDVVTSIENMLYGEQLRLTGHTDEVLTISVSADGKRLLTSSDDKTLRLWDAVTGKELRVFEGHTDLIYGAALSPDGKRLLSASYDPERAVVGRNDRQGNPPNDRPHRRGDPRGVRSGGPGAFLRRQWDDVSVGFEHRQEGWRLYRAHRFCVPPRLQ